MYIFVLNTEQHGLPVLLVYFWSQEKPIRSHSLYQSDNIMLYVDPIYCYYSSTCIFLFLTIIPIILYLHLYVLVLYNNSLSSDCTLLMSICLLSHTHTQYLNIVSDDNSFPKELALITFWLNNNIDVSVTTTIWNHT
jgi:hypothetical protein